MNMSYFERRSIFGVIHTIVVTILFYFLYLSPNVMDQTVFDPSAWALAIVIYLGIIIVTRILLIILHSIIEGIIVNMNNEGSFKEIYKEDERFKLIDLKASQAIGSIISLGFLIAMVMLAFGMQLVYLFYVMFSALVLAGIITDILIVYYHQRGV